jgi:phosphatidylglycerol:prolipoprotein diacylglycerol transferase
MHPYLFKIGDFPIRSFSVMVLIGVLCAAWWVTGALRRQGVEGEGVLDHILRNALLLGFLGARLTYVLVHPEVYRNVISLVAVWQGGLVSYGGFFGGALGAWLFARRRGIPFARLGDALFPALALGQTFGRIGCLLVGDDHGKPWDGPWAITFPRVEGSLMPDELIGVPLHPAQLYLSLMDLLLFLSMAWLYRRRRFDGQVLGTGMLLYAVGRSLIELTRGDDEARGFWGALSTAQWISLATFAAGILLLVVQRRRPATTGMRGAAPAGT